jgi:hypothetical protein
MLDAGEGKLSRNLERIREWRGAHQRRPVGDRVTRPTQDGSKRCGRPFHSFVCFLLSPALGQQSQERQTVIVGPWNIATTYKGDKFESCTMSRSASGLGISFIRNQDGLLLNLDSTKWKLERGNAYTVRLAAGSQSVDAKALAETKGVTIAFADRSFNDNLRKANFLEVRGEGATIRVPLDGSTMALDRLEACFEKNGREGRETNPFVAPSRRP